MFVAYVLTRNIRYDEDLVAEMFNSGGKRLDRVPQSPLIFSKERVPGCASRYSIVPAFLGGSVRQTYRNLSSLDVTTGIFFSRVTRFKAERRFCIFSPLRLLSGTLTAC